MLRGLHVQLQVIAMCNCVFVGYRLVRGWDWDWGFEVMKRVSHATCVTVLQCTLYHPEEKHAIAINCL
eukprot:4538907-Amphidinium_carterae.1